MLRRFLILWCVLHIILLVVELIRYPHNDSILKFKDYFEEKLLLISYAVLFLDGFGCVFAVGYVFCKYIMEGTLL